MMFGVTPQYLAMWLLWRGASIAMPDWLYQWGDDKLYSLYQRLVLFFFETCTGVEVRCDDDVVRQASWLWYWARLKTINFAFCMPSLVPHCIRQQLSILIDLSFISDVHRDVGQVLIDVDHYCAFRYLAVYR